MKVPQFLSVYLQTFIGFLNEYIGKFIFKINFFSEKWRGVYFPLISFFILSLLSFFLNYVSNLCSDLDLFKLDISEKNPSFKKKKMIFIFKNTNLLFSFVSFLQVIINFYISSLFIDKVLKFIDSNKSFVILLISISIAFFTEIFSRYISSKKYSRKLLNNNFFINIAFFLTRFPSLFFSNFVNNKKKFFDNSEKDLNVFLNNLVLENVLEEKESKLVSSALKLDETKVNSIFKKDIISFDYFMNLEELIDFHLNHYFSTYPVFKDNVFLGILNMKSFQKIFEKERKLNDCNYDWHNKIEIDNVIFISKNEKLDLALEKIENSKIKFAIVLNKKIRSKTNSIKLKKKDLLGILTIRDISYYLLHGGNKKKKKKVL